MGFLIPVLAGVVLLFTSGLLLSTVGRRRRPVARPLRAAELAAIEGVLGAGLAGLVGHSVELRQRIEDVAQHELELLEIERDLGGSPRRPLWRQIEAANFDQELARVQRETLAWLARYAGLETRDRQILDQLAIDVEPVRRLVDDAPGHGGELATPGGEAPRSGASSPELHQRQARLDSAAACLRRLELEISGYRGGVYR